MSHANMLEHVKAELDQVDAEALRSISEIIKQAKRKSAAVPESAVGSAPSRADEVTKTSEPLRFVGENLTLKEYENLSLKARGLLNLHLKEKNHQWLQKKFAALNAAWLVVVDGKVIASGKSLKDEPMPPQILEICHDTGKFPFVFINDAFLSIEEGASTWHETNTPDDFYPTLPITLTAPQNDVEIEGDFDTGASHSFADYDFLFAQNLILSESGDAFKSSRHLNQPYFYVTKLVRFKLSAKSSFARAVETKIRCVFDWRLSPFIAINPNRIALIGRDVLLELKPQVLLDFEKRQTEIGASVKPEPTRKKSAIRKKRTPRRR